MPVGFTGSADLRAKIRYDATGSTWEWISYIAVDPESRYVNTTDGYISERLGIGVQPSATAALDVSYNSNSSGLGINLKNESTSAGATTSLKFNASNGASGAELFLDSAVPGGAPYDFHIKNRQSNASTCFDNSVGTELARITPEGRLGIGTTSPSHLLQVKSTSTSPETIAGFGNGSIDPGLEITTDGNLEWGFNAYNSRSLTFSTNQTERGRFTEGGQFLVGTPSLFGTNIAGINYSAPREQLAGTDGNQTTKLIAQYSTSNFSPTLAFAKSLSPTLGDQTAVNVNYPIGRVTAAGSDGVKFIEGARIDFVADAAFSLDSSPTRVAFFTTPSGSSTPLERMQIDSSGNCGIGTTNPTRKLDVNGGAKIGAPTGDAVIKVGQGATENRFAFIDFVGDTTYTGYGLRLIRFNTGANTTSQLTHRGTGDLSIRTEEAAGISFITNNLERAHIDSTGRLLVGTDAPLTTTSNGLTSAPYLVTAGSNTGRATAGVFYYNNSDLDAASLCLSKSRNSTIGQHSILLDDDTIGAISYSGSNGSTFREAARINAEVNGTPAGNSMPGRLVFSTTASGDSSPTERMRINSDGTTVFSGAVTLPAGSTVAGYRATFNHITATVNTTINDHQWVSVLNSGTTITLPANPTDGMEVRISVGNFTNTVVARNGANIMNAAADLTIDVAYKTVTLIYDGLTVGPTPVFGWRII